MSCCFSRAVNYVKGQAMPLTMGVACGYLGHATVRWLTDHNTSTLPLGTFHLITYKNNQPELRILSYPDFKNHISITQLNNLRESVGFGKRSAQIWEGVFTRSANITCVTEDAQLVAYASVVGNGRIGIISDMHILPSHRDSELSVVTMNNLVSEMREQGFKVVNLFGYEGSLP